MKKNTIIRTIITIFGLSICGLAVGMFKHANFGIDPFQTFVVGIHSKTTLSFGFVYSIVNVVFLVFVFFIKKHYIGIGTVINLFLIGYMVEFSGWIMQVLLPNPEMWLRIVLLLVGFLVLCLGSAFYITADLGVSTYDAVALIMADKKIAKFQYCRIATDILCVLVGFLLGSTIGVGTIMIAFFMGPFVAFFRRVISDPLLQKLLKEE